jgi:hypothetical protein
VARKQKINIPKKNRFDWQYFTCFYGVKISWKVCISILLAKFSLEKSMPED